MGIDELFSRLQKKFIVKKLDGRLTLFGNCIIWEYSPDMANNFVPDVFDGEGDNAYADDNAYGDDGDAMNWDFDSFSYDESLWDYYSRDRERIELFLYEIGEQENWSISNPDTLDGVISFKIF